MVTTLYDLITALHESSEPGEEDLVTAAEAEGVSQVLISYPV